MSVKLFIIILLLLLCGCVTTKEPEVKDTRFDRNQRDWLTIYRTEIRVAVENEDEEAYHFFMHEYLKERVRIWKIYKKERATEL